MESKFHTGCGILLAHRELASLKALIYADLFDFPLTEEELWRRLICPSKINQQEWKKELTDWVVRKKIGRKEGYYFLPGREGNIAKRQRGEKFWPSKFALAQKAASLLKKIPTVYFIGLTGNLALGTAQADDDIDLMIITAPGALWLTRLWIYLLLVLNNMRWPISSKARNKLRLSARCPSEKSASDKLCLNLFLDGSDLEMEAGNQNLFIAHEIAFIKPLINKKQTYERFLSANQWVREFLPNAFSLKSMANTSRRIIFVELRGVFFRFFNYPCYWFQRFYMRGKPLAKKVSLTQAFFHPRDQSGKIMNRFVARCKKEKIPFGR